jgi:hypothetical protein
MSFRAGDVPFRAKRDGSLAPIWQHLWNDLPGPRLYEEVPSDGTRIPYVVQLQFPNEQLRYQVQTAIGFIDVMEITLFADLWIERELVPLAVVDPTTAKIMCWRGTPSFTLTMNTPSWRLAFRNTRIKKRSQSPYGERVSPTYPHSWRSTCRLHSRGQERRSCV